MWQWGRTTRGVPHHTVHDNYLVFDGIRIAVSKNPKVNWIFILSSSANNTYTCVNFLCCCAIRFLFSCLRSDFEVHC